MDEPKQYAGRCDGCGCVMHRTSWLGGGQCEHCGIWRSDEALDRQQHWPYPGQMVRSWFNGERFRVGCHVGGGRGWTRCTPLESPGKNIWYRDWPADDFPDNFWAVYELVR